MCTSKCIYNMIRVNARRHVDERSCCCCCCGNRDIIIILLQRATGSGMRNEIKIYDVNIKRVYYVHAYIICARF
jgi:hypothetical protein